MTTFAYPTDISTDGELAADMASFDGKRVALKAIQSKTVSVKTKFGQSDALRVEVIDLDTGVLTSPHLLFWSKVQEQVLRTHQSGVDWAIGRIENQPQHADPSRSVWLLVADETIDFDSVGTTIARATRVDSHVAADDDAPFAT